MCALHGIGHESRAPNPSTSKHGVGIGGELIEIHYKLDSNHDFIRPCRAIFKHTPREGGVMYPKITKNIGEIDG